MSKPLRVRYLASAAASVFLAAWLTSCHSEPHTLEICEVRDSPRRFIGRVFELRGWIYADIENLAIDDQQCALQLLFNSAEDSESKRFDQMLKSTMQTIYRSDDVLFIIATGTLQPMSQSSDYISDNGKDYNFAISRFTCVAEAPMQTNALQRATSKCLSEATIHQ